MVVWNPHGIVFSARFTYFSCNVPDSLKIEGICTFQDKFEPDIVLLALRME